MIDEIKILLGDKAALYSEDLIGLCAKQALVEVEAYCGRTPDFEMELAAERIAIIKLNRLNSEGLAAQSYSGVNESYVDGWPADIKALLNRKRKIKFM